jgi:hypothetical protein
LDRSAATATTTASEGNPHAMHRHTHFTVTTAAARERNHPHTTRITGTHAPAATRERRQRRRWDSSGFVEYRDRSGRRCKLDMAGRGSPSRNSRRRSAARHTTGRTVGVEHLGHEAHFGSLVWIVLCELHQQVERAALPRRLVGSSETRHVNPNTRQHVAANPRRGATPGAASHSPKDHCLPVHDIALQRRRADARRWIRLHLAQVAHKAPSGRSCPARAAAPHSSEPPAPINVHASQNRSIACSDRGQQRWHDV